MNPREIVQHNREQMEKTVFGKTAVNRAYRKVFGCPEGKVVLKDMMKRTCFLEPTMVAGDPMATAFNEGRRSIILFLLKKLNTTEMDLIDNYDEQTIPPPPGA